MGQYVYYNCLPGCDVINLEINLIFQIKPFFYMTKKSRQKLNILRMERWNKKHFSGKPLHTQSLAVLFDVQNSLNYWKNRLSILQAYFFRGRWTRYLQIYLNESKIPKFQHLTNSEKVYWHLVYWIHWLQWLSAVSSIIPSNVIRHWG